MFCFSVLSALGAEAEAEETGHVAKGLVTLLLQWGTLVLWVIASFPSLQAIFGKEKDPVMTHEHMEARENYICVARNSFDLSGQNLPKLGHLLTSPEWLEMKAVVVNEKKQKVVLHCDQWFSPLPSPTSTTMVHI